MKVKLLKKIRKRYSITHYPNGVFLHGDFYKGPITIIEDSENSYRYRINDEEKSLAYKELYPILLKWIQKDYGTFKSRRHRITSEKLWYKNK